MTDQKTISALVSILKKNSYYINEQPNGINIVGVRADSVKPNTFDDRLYMFWKNLNNQWEGKDYPITTDPGTYYLLNPSRVEGTAILKQGQWPYQLGLHRGYEALVQRGPVTVIRDYDRNAILDFNNGREMTGLFGINIHRARLGSTTTAVDDWSAGCQVFANSSDFAEFMAQAKKSIALYGNSKLFYSLIDFRAMSRALKQNTGLILLIMAGLGYIVYRHQT